MVARVGPAGAVERFFGGVHALRWQHQTLEIKCSGLDAALLARRAVEPSTLSLPGILRHLADVERIWFRRVMTGG